MKITKDTTWDNLTEEEKQIWNGIAKMHQQYFIHLKWAVKRKVCFMCKHKHKTTAELDFHLRTTHGFSLDEIIRAKILKDNEKSIS